MHVIQGEMHMRKTSRWFIAFVFLAILSGCGRTALNEAKAAGLAARQTAEAAYLTLRVESLLGRVDEPTMEAARRLYTRYAAAQRAYVDALALWEAGGPAQDPAALSENVIALAADLQALAESVRSGGKRE
jgi:hypothetical protein